MSWKVVLALVGGGIAGLLLSALSRKMGSNCSILCNPMIAVIYGALLGLLMVLGQNQPQK